MWYSMEKRVEKQCKKTNQLSYNDIPSKRVKNAKTEFQNKGPVQETSDIPSVHFKTHTLHTLIE